MMEKLEVTRVEEVGRSLIKFEIEVFIFSFSPLLWLF
jgi:hypothetical protein